MLVFELFTWWYRRGWLAVAKHAERRFFKVSHLFSVPILLRTLFSPWRRIVTYPGASFEARLRAMGDNLVSRMVGFTVRSMVLVAAGVMLLVTSVYSLLEFVLWPFVPPLIAVLLVLGVVG